MRDGAKIFVVYFIFIDPASNWRRIISGQLEDLKKYGILDSSELHIHITDTYHIDLSLEFVRAKVPNAIITTSTQNQYEYPAMKKIYDLACNNKDAIIMYLHTKGMSYKINKRAKIEKTLLKLTFENWRFIIDKLQSSPTINKAGLLPHLRGKHVWLNFWYAKTNYITKLKIPEISDDRFYYEWWLGRVKEPDYPFHDGYCIYLNTEKFDGFYSGTAAEIIKELVQKEYKNTIFFENISLVLHQHYKRLKNVTRRLLYSKK